MKIVLSPEQKLKIHNERRTLADKVNELMIGKWFTVTELAKLLRIEHEQALGKLNELIQGYFIKQSTREQRERIYKVVVDDASRKELLEMALIQKTDRFSKECEYINDLLDLIGRDEKGA